MADLDIVVRLDPGQPVAGAKAVTAELAKTETQAKKTEDAAAGIAKLNFKQAAAGVSQAFGLINEKLKLTDSAFGKAAESAIKFGAMGAQIAGPWGAAAGALVGAMIEIDGGFGELIDSAERLEDSLKTVAERTNELIEGSTTFNGQLRALTSGAHTLSEGIVLVTAHLQRLHDKTAQFSSLGPVLKAINDQLAAQKQILGEIDGPLTKYSTSTTALHMLWKTGAIDAIEYTHRTAGITAALASADPAMAAMTAQHAAGAAAAKAHADELKRYAEAVRKANTPQYDGEIPDAISGGATPADPLTAQWKTSELDVGAQKPFEMKDIKGASGDLTDIEKAFDAKRVEDWKKELEASKKTVDEIAQHMKPLEDFFVTAATTGKLEWRSMVDSMIADLARLAAQKAIMGIVGAAFGSGAGPVGGVASGAGDGLMGTGYASGGTIWPSGGGTADTQSVSFRKRPDETVHINTPSQEAAYQRGGQGGGSRTQTVNVQADDQRALLQGFDGPEGDRVFLNVVRRNPNAFAALLPRR